MYVLILRVLAPTYTLIVSSSSRFNTTSTHHVQQYIQYPTHTRTHPPYTAAQQYSCTVCCCVVLGLPCFYYPPPTGIELVRPLEQLSTPAARRCRLPCVSKYNSSHCCCAIYHSQAEFLVVSPSFLPVSSPKTLQR